MIRRNRPDARSSLRASGAGGATRKPAIEQRRTVGTRQLGVKLANEHGPALERRDERNPVGCPRRRPPRRALAQGVGVRERRDASGQQTGFWFGRHAVPTEMRDPHTRRQPATGSSDNAESATPGVSSLARTASAFRDKLSNGVARRDIRLRSRVRGIGAPSCPLQMRPRLARRAAPRHGRRPGRP